MWKASSVRLVPNSCLVLQKTLPRLGLWENKTNTFKKNLLGLESEHEGEILLSFRKNHFFDMFVPVVTVTLTTEFGEIGRETL